MSLAEISMPEIELTYNLRQRFVSGSFYLYCRLWQNIQESIQAQTATLL